MVGGAQLLLRGRQRQQPQLVGQRGLAQPQAAGGLGLGAAPQADDLLDAARRVKGVQLAALQVFQQAQRRALAVVVVGQNRRDLLEFRQPAGAQAALARHQLVLVQPGAPHADGLQQPVLQNAHGQRRDLLFVKGRARLVGRGLDAVQRQHQHAAGLLGFFSGHGGSSLRVHKKNRVCFLCKKHTTPHAKGK